MAGLAASRDSMASRGAAALKSIWVEPSEHIPVALGALPSLQSSSGIIISEVSSGTSFSTRSGVALGTHR